MRIGHGYDVHKLVEGRKLILGGIEVDYTLGLLGHSDADVLTHAICDALLGAAALGDIGVHFPPSDQKYKGISSIVLLSEVVNLLHGKGYTIGNIDATIIAQAPRLSSYLPLMAQKIADTLSCATDDVSIKATTEEGLGFTGTGQGIAAHCVCLIQKN